MNKKDYMKPQMKVVKIQANQLLTVSNDAPIYNQKSSNASYSRESSSGWDDED
ncbi:MAG: hypothetical protein IKQ59_02990 [Prevotella sp.]|nr:hypothetical protein [Prevotella sp.]